MRSGKPKGTLILIGGAEDKEGERAILREFVSRSGGSKARIVVMTVATDHPDEVGERYIEVFKDLGAGEATMVDVSQRMDVHAESSLAMIGQASGVFFTGGDQLHITSLLGGTEMDRLLHERYQDGVVLAGTSAGAAMMSNSMIIGGSSETAPRMEGVRMAPGMEFILGAAIDTHFSQRGRHGRLLTAVAHYPHDLGIGLDEDTAIIVEDQVFEVIGSGSVTIFDLGSVTYTNLPDLSQYDLLSLFDIKVHVLPCGFRFDVANRRPLMPPTEAQHDRAVDVAAERSVAAPRTAQGSSGAGTNDATYGSSTAKRISTVERGPGAGSGSSAAKDSRGRASGTEKKGSGSKRAASGTTASGMTVGKAGGTGTGTAGKNGTAAKSGTTPKNGTAAKNGTATKSRRAAKNGATAKGGTATKSGGKKRSGSSSSSSKRGGAKPSSGKR